MSRTYREEISSVMSEMLQKNSQAICYGLGVTDHVGIFGTTLGLRDKYGTERVFDVPLCEESMLGFALGASLGGLYPINIHIRNDFLLLGMNQIVNSIAKYKSMYGGQFQAPMLIRAVIGRSWGQGAQHSQSLQALFAHIPGLTVIMPSRPETLREAYMHAMQSYPSPVISLEHRWLYDYSFAGISLPKNLGFSSYVLQEGRDVTVVATSVMVQEAQRAASYLKQKHDLEIEIIDLNCVSHPNTDLVLKSLAKTKRLVVADTSWAAYGVAAEVSRWVAEAGLRLDKPMKTLANAPTPCPTSKALEKYFYPDWSSLVVACEELTEQKISSLPEAEVQAQYKQFKGPF